MEATLQQFDALRSPGRTIREHVDGFVGRMMAAVLEVAAVLQSYGYQFVNDQARPARGLAHLLRKEDCKGHEADDWADLRPLRPR